MTRRSARRTCRRLIAALALVTALVAATGAVGHAAADPLAGAGEVLLAPPGPGPQNPAPRGVELTLTEKQVLNTLRSGPLVPDRSRGVLSPGRFDLQIVGGGSASTVPADSVALIRYDDPGTADSPDFSCSGTLVAPQWVLTAGHCVVEYTNGGPTRAPLPVGGAPLRFQVTFGLNAPQAGQPAIGGDQVVLNDGYLLRQSSEDVPGYGDTGGWVNGISNVVNETGLDDFALLHLAAPAPGTPLPLAVDDSLGQAGRTVWAAGFGLTNFRANIAPTTLQEVTLTLANSTFCEIAWREFFSATSSTCYFGPTAATCHGDSGGPILTQDETGTWWLVASVSGGASGCPVNSPYVGPRSQWMAAWVAQITGVAQPGRPGESFTPLVPSRIIDSRDGLGVSFIPPTVLEPAALGIFLPQPTLPANFVTRRPIYGPYGVAGIPLGGVAGVVLNVTVDRPVAGGFVAVYPCSDGWTGTSSVNFAAGQTVANMVVTKVDRNGDVCFLAAENTALIVDITGWIGPQGPQRATVSATPSRLFDSRETGRMAARETRAVQVTGPGRAPVGAKAAVLNLTSTQTEANGFVTAWPCDAPQPTASSLNPVAGRDVANLVMVQLDGAGRVCLYTELASQLVVDLNGWVVEASPATLKTVIPRRLFDTRDSAVPVGAASVYQAQVAGLTGVPGSGVDSVMLNVTATQTAGPGYVTVFPCGSVPLASNLNFVADQTVPNAVLAKLSPSGQVCFYTTTSTHLVVDVTGYVRS